MPVSGTSHYYVRRDSYVDESVVAGPLVPSGFCHTALTFKIVNSRRSPVLDGQVDFAGARLPEFKVATVEEGLVGRHVLEVINGDVDVVCVRVADRGGH